VANIAHHVTQRGNARQFLLATENERVVYLELLQRYVKLHDVSVLGYCVMSNHVHLIAIPQQAESLGQALKETHGRYASYWNAAHQSSGHVWQGRFYSCPLDEAHLWVALRYAELNPVRAGLVAEAERWAWSSAASHCGNNGEECWLEMDLWSKRWSAERWRDFLKCGEDERELRELRKCTHTGRPLGSKEFIRGLEESTGRLLEARVGGRRRSEPQRSGQGNLGF
jgi:putative transposase